MNKSCPRNRGDRLVSLSGPTKCVQKCSLQDIVQIYTEKVYQDVVLVYYRFHGPIWDTFAIPMVGNKIRQIGHISILKLTLKLNSRSFFVIFHIAYSLGSEKSQVYFLWSILPTVISKSARPINNQNLDTY